MITLKGETFAGFKIQRQSVFCFVIDVASVILSLMCIGLPRQCRKQKIRDIRKSQIALRERWKQHFQASSYRCQKLPWGEGAFPQIPLAARPPPPPVPPPPPLR